MMRIEAIDYEIPYEGTELSSRLRNWAAWNQRKEPNRLSYPISPIARMEVPDQEHRRQPRSTPDAMDALQIERVVIRLPAQNRVIVTVHYLLEYLPRETKLRACAQKGYAINKSRYYDVLKQSECMLKNLLTRVDKMAQNSPQFIYDAKIASVAKR